MANFFYLNLTKSRCFYVFQKHCRWKGIYNIIRDKYSEISYINQKKLFIKFLINCFHKKKLLITYNKLRRKRHRILVFDAFCKKINYFIQQKKLYFIQLTNNQFSVKFLINILSSIDKLVAQSHLNIRKKNRINIKISHVYLRNSYYKKQELYKILKNNLIQEKYKE